MSNNWAKQNRKLKVNIPICNIDFSSIVFNTFNRFWSERQWRESEYVQALQYCQQDGWTRREPPASGPGNKSSDFLNRCGRSGLQRLALSLRNFPSKWCESWRSVLHFHSKPGTARPCHRRQTHRPEARRSHCRSYRRHLLNPFPRFNDVRRARLWFSV